MHIVFNQKVPSKSSFSSISDITVREKTDNTLNKLKLILVKHTLNYNFDFFHTCCFLLSILRRKSVLSVPYSLVIVQPYTPQSCLDARTIASATWLSSPPLEHKMRKNEEKNPHTHNHERIQLRDSNSPNNPQDVTVRQMHVLCGSRLLTQRPLAHI